jgi:hypothetical protein
MHAHVHAQVQHHVGAYKRLVDHVKHTVAAQGRAMSQKMVTSCRLLRHGAYVVLRAAVMCLVACGILLRLGDEMMCMMGWRESAGLLFIIKNGKKETPVGRMGFQAGE